MGIEKGTGIQADSKLWLALHDGQITLDSGDVRRGGGGGGGGPTLVG